MYAIALPTKEHKSIGLYPHSCNALASLFAFQMPPGRRWLYLEILNKNRQMLRNGHDAFQKIWPLLNFSLAIEIQVVSWEKWN